MSMTRWDTNKTEENNLGIYNYLGNLSIIITYKPLFWGEKLPGKSQEKIYLFNTLF